MKRRYNVQVGMRFISRYKHRPKITIEVVEILYDAATHRIATVARVRNTATGYQFRIPLKNFAPIQKGYEPLTTQGDADATPSTQSTDRTTTQETVQAGG